MFDDDVEIIDKPKKRGRPPQIYDAPPKDDVKKAFGFALAVAKLNTGRVQSPEELEQRFEELFNIAYDQGIIPRYEHLVLVSGLPKRTFFDYGNEDNPSAPSQIFSPVIKKAKNLISAMEARISRFWQNTSTSLYLSWKELWWTSWCTRNTGWTNSRPN